MLPQISHEPNHSACRKEVLNIILLKIQGVASLVKDPSRVNSTPLQNTPFCQLFIAVTFKPNKQETAEAA